MKLLTPVTRIFLGAFALFVLTPVLSVMNLPHLIVGKVAISDANANPPEGTNCTGGGECFSK